MPIPAIPRTPRPLPPATLTFLEGLADRSPEERLTGWLEQGARHPDLALQVRAAVRDGADLEMQAVVNGRLISGCPTWLAWSTYLGRASTVLALLDAGAVPFWHVSPRDDLMAQGAMEPGVITPLHLAFRRGHRALASALLKHPSLDVHALDESRATVLHEAMSANAGYALGALLRAGADRLLPDADGLTPIARAWDAGHGVLAQRLEAPLLRAALREVRPPHASSPRLARPDGLDPVGPRGRARL